jgi:hypothetical protein
MEGGMSEFVELHDIEGHGAPFVVLINLDQVSSIYQRRDGAEVWFLQHPEDKNLGRIRVSESPADILRLRRETRNADRT